MEGVRLTRGYVHATVNVYHLTSLTYIRVGEGGWNGAPWFLAQS